MTEQDPAPQAKRRRRHSRPGYIGAFIPWQLKAKLTYAAEEAGRTLAAEIAERLEASFRPKAD